ncbi:MAG: Zn-dependent hydrolase [Acidimicrobiales bacterium]
MDDLRVNVSRLLDRLGELAAIGAIEGTLGSSRLALTDEDRAGRDLVRTWMADLGMEITIDAIGNVTGTWRGAKTDASLAPVMTGSHIDTVATGGRYDGNLGVLGGIEVVETLARAGISPRRPIAVAFFTDEEGARFAPDMLGSLVYVGGMSVEEALDIEGVDGAILGDELDRIGYRGPSPCPGPAPYAYIELHIEQGPVLEATGTTIGAVESVQGISWTEVTIAGQSNHAGTTPMDLRCDAGYVAARIASFVRDLAVKIGGSQVGTVGAIDLHPNLVNVVAGGATMTVDLRNTDDATLVEAERQLGRYCDGLATEEGVTIERRVLARFEPVEFDERLVDMVENAAKGLHHRVRRMPSGAGHDAQMFARLCPTAMIFTPSVGGLSHNPAEHTEPADIEAGANVLLHTILRLAEEETCPDQ